MPASSRGWGLLDLYSAVNAGKVGRYNASDANNGGAPGTVADKVNSQMGAHRAKATAFLGGEFKATMPGESGGTARAPFSLSGTGRQFGFGHYDPCRAREGR